MEKMIEKSASERLDEIQKQLDYLEGVTQICAAAFSNKGFMSDVNEHDVANAFYSVHDQIAQIKAEIKALI